MKTYSAPEVDLYMRTQLEQDLSREESDNALTLLTTLTTLAPSLFPYGRTFVQVDKRLDWTQMDNWHVNGIRFCVLSEEGVERSIFLPITDLDILQEGMTSLFGVLGTSYYL